MTFPVGSAISQSLIRRFHQNDLLPISLPQKAISYQIFLSHIPLYNSPYISERARQCWEPLLHEFNPNLMLAGHDHTWRKTVPPTASAPWPVLVGGGPSLNEGTVMLLSADGKKLRTRLLAGTDGRILTEFSAVKSNQNN